MKRPICLGLVLVMVLSVCAAFSACVPEAHWQRQIDDLNKQIARQDTKLAEQNSKLAEQALLIKQQEDRIAALEQEKQALEARIEELEEENKALRDKIEELEEKIEDLKPWDLDNSICVYVHSYYYDEVFNNLDTAFSYIPNIKTILVISRAPPLPPGTTSSRLTLLVILKKGGEENITAAVIALNKDLRVGDVLWTPERHLPSYYSNKQIRIHIDGDPEKMYTVEDFPQVKLAAVKPQQYFYESYINGGVTLVLELAEPGFRNLFEAANLFALDPEFIIVWIALPWQEI